jgi:putative aminopeptidase FrvX
MHQFLLEYIQHHSPRWAVKPEVYYGDAFQHCIVLVFGKPRTAVFTHIDNIGFTVRYGRQLVRIGGPRLASGYRLYGKDSDGDIECILNADDEEHLIYESNRLIERGTALSFKANYREDEQSVQCCYLDNRIGVFASLKICETLEDGIVIFSCREEHHGGTVPFLAKFIHERYNIKQALVCDITWITEGIEHGKGIVISRRDSGIPRRVYFDRITGILKEAGLPFQVEVESSGGSDGNELQRQPYPIDWCFAGAAEDHVHTPDERVYKTDIESMIDAYKLLMKKL